MKNYPSITVVIPAHNEEKYIEPCLQSLFAQTYPRENYQVLLVDNNSTDKTAAIAKEFGLTIIHEKKQGYVHALRSGMSAAQGDIIAVTDADTQVSQNWLEVIASAFHNDNVVAVTGLVRFNAKSRLMGVTLSALYTVFAKTSTAMGKPNLTGFNFAVRKEVFERIGGLNTSYEMSPDVELGLRMKRVGKVITHNKLFVKSSARRWEDRFFPTIWEYTKGYLFTIWLRKPPKVKQKVIR